MKLPINTSVVFIAILSQELHMNYQVVIVRNVLRQAVAVPAPSQLREANEDFVAYYNHQCYHESLDNRTPAVVYQDNVNSG
ncbi:MAG: hypothetical protein PVG14_00545 [Anaerolineales bacterium]